MSKRLATLLANTAAADPIACASAAGEPLRTLQLLPIGPIVSKRDGRRWTIRDQAHAQSIVEASIAAAAPADIPCDYDHQLQFAATPGVGGVAPASGWVTNLRVDGGFIVGDVEWTAKASAAIQAKEYRYVSPVFGHSASGEVSRILQVALTNYPAITELAAVASADPNGDSMDLTALAAALGLPATATLEQIVAAASAARTAASQLALLATACGITGETTAEAVATAMAARQPDPTKFVPITELASANARLKALEDAAATSAATAEVDAAIGAGKVTPGNRDWAMGYAAKDLAGFKAFVAGAPVVAAASGLTASAKTAPPEKVTELTAEQLAVCKATGVSPEAFLKTLKEEIAHGRA